MKTTIERDIRKSFPRSKSEISLITEGQTKKAPGDPHPGLSIHALRIQAMAYFTRIILFTFVKSI